MKLYFCQVECASGCEKNVLAICGSRGPFNRFASPSIVSDIPSCKSPVSLPSWLAPKFTTKGQMPFTRGDGSCSLGEQRATAPTDHVL